MVFVQSKKKGAMTAIIAGWAMVSLMVLPLFAHPGHRHPVVGHDSVLSVSHDSQNALSEIKVQQQPVVPEGIGTMGIDEKPGAMVPLDLMFANQQGDSVTLRSCLKGPTILSLLYYGCPNACGLLLSGMALSLRSYADNPGKAPNVITISIGEKEGPVDARKAEAIATASMQKPYPAGHWQFLTGSEENIKKVTEAVGFHFIKKEGDYDHPLGIIFLSPAGKVTHYINGTDFLPAEITMSLMEASSGTVEPTIARVLRACFSVDPKSHRLVFRTLQVGATVIITLLLVFIGYLFLASRSRRTKGGRHVGS
jgi:protein SCO1